MRKTKTAPREVREAVEIDDAGAGSSASVRYPVGTKGRSTDATTRVRVASTAVGVGLRTVRAPSGVVTANTIPMARPAINALVQQGWGANPLPYSRGAGAGSFRSSPDRSVSDGPLGIAEIDSSTPLGDLQHPCRRQSPPGPAHPLHLLSPIRIGKDGSCDLGGAQGRAVGSPPDHTEELRFHTLVEPARSALAALRAVADLLPDVGPPPTPTEASAAGRADLLFVFRGHGKGRYGIPPLDARVEG